MNTIEWLLSEEALEIGRKAVEDELIEWRDSRISELGRRNGLVIREKDGTASEVIRFGPETALRVGLRAMLAVACSSQPSEGYCVEGQGCICGTQTVRQSCINWRK